MHENKAASQCICRSTKWHAVWNHLWTQSAILCYARIRLWSQGIFSSNEAVCECIDSLNVSFVIRANMKIQPTFPDDKKWLVQIHQIKIPFLVIRNKSVLERITANILLRKLGHIVRDMWCMVVGTYFCIEIVITNTFWKEHSDISRYL